MADARLRGDARGCDGGVRGRLAAGAVLRLGGPLSGAGRRSVEAGPRGCPRPAPGAALLRQHARDVVSFP
jgi:hypothetical protein